MIRVKRSTVIIFLALVLIAVIDLIAVRSYYEGVRPPPGCTIESLAISGGFGRIREVQKDGSLFYLVDGKYPPDYVVPSGPPVYAFDSKGSMVDWTQDCGDDSSWMRKWDALPSRKVSLEQVLESIRGQAMRGDDKATPSSEAEEPRKQVCVFKGRVARIAVLTEYTGKIIPVGIDPLFVAVIDKLQIVSGSVPGAEGQSSVAFAIHSPTLMFRDAGGAAVGNWYEFTLSSQDTRGKPWYHLEAAPAESDK